MKKSLLFIAAAALAFNACQDTDSFKKDIKGNNSETTINFSTFTEKVTRGDNSAENSNAYYNWLFLDNHDDFQVWSYKSNAADKTKPVFDGTVVSVSKNGTTTKYEYSPLRFWDKIATKYHYYAAAPANPAEAWHFENDKITSADNLGKGYWTTTSTIVGINLKNLAATQDAAENGPGANLSKYFKNKGEIDKLIAAPCEVNQPSYAKPSPDAVQLNFIHILSKLNVTIKKAGKLLDKKSATSEEDLYTVVLKEFAVKSVPNKGDFDESTPADKTGDNERWELNGATTTDYVALSNLNTKEFTVTGTANYIVESLVIPQDIDYKVVALDGQHHNEEGATDAVLFADYEEYTKSNPEEALTKDEFDAIKDNSTDPTELAKITKIPAKDAVPEIAAVTTDPKPYFYIKYTINNEEFEAYYNLAAAFGATVSDGNDQNGDETKIAFNEGWQNTLNIVINPTAIEFTADVADWAAADDNSATIYIDKQP